MLKQTKEGNTVILHFGFTFCSVATINVPTDRWGESSITVSTCVSAQLRKIYNMHVYRLCIKQVITSSLLFFISVVHIVGHTVNFYHISTQTPSDLTCLFRNFYRATHELPKFHYWCWGTITGM